MTLSPWAVRVVAATVIASCVGFMLALGYGLAKGA